MNNSTINKWLDDLAGYFERRDPHGEDRAHWANVYNAEAARKIKAALSAAEGEIERLRAENVRMREALTPFVNLVAKNEEGEIEDQLEGLPDGHAFGVCWRFDDAGDKSPWVSAGQFRRARAALEGEGQPPPPSAPQKE